LPAGTYTIEFTDASTGIGEWAPPEQYTFTVTGDGQTWPCDSLSVLNLTWAAFSDTALVVQVMNNSSALFDYPNFILFDEGGDTLAVETVNFFGIAGMSWHILRIHDGATIPEDPFAARLELWTGFSEALACTWESVFDLCPPLPCLDMDLVLNNMGQPEVEGTYNWWLSGGPGEDEWTGTFTLTSGIQYAWESVCLEPGSYVYNVSPADMGTPDGPAFYGTTIGSQNTNTGIATSSLPMIIEFDFYGPCASGSQSVVEHRAPTLHTAPAGRGLQAWLPEGGPLGEVWLFDVQGRLLYHNTVTTDRLFIPVERPGVYILRAGERTVKVVAGLE